MPHTAQQKRVAGRKTAVQSAMDRLKAARKTGNKAAVAARKKQLIAAQDTLRRERRGSGKILKNDPSRAKDTAAQSTTRRRIQPVGKPSVEPKKKAKKKATTGFVKATGKNRATVAKRRAAIARKLARSRRSTRRSTRRRSAPHSNTRGTGRRR